MNYLPVAITAYALNAGAITIDKILIKHSLPKPIVYTFYVNLLQLSAVLLLPFARDFGSVREVILAIASGITFTLALHAMFTGLVKNEASVVGPVVGMLNPFFALILGSLFLSQTLSSQQYLGFFVLLVGSAVLTANIWLSKLRLDDRLGWLIISGLLFAVSYVLLREVYLEMDFVSGLVATRAASGIFVLSFLAFPLLRKEIFAPRGKDQEIGSRTATAMLFLGQAMGAVSGLLISYGISLASPALVNSLFGVQYLFILIIALVLIRQHPHLLDENLTKQVVALKTAGAAVISLGLFLLAQ